MLLLLIVLTNLGVIVSAYLGCEGFFFNLIVSPSSNNNVSLPHRGFKAIKTHVQLNIKLN
jgi:hypothetical protein